MLTANTIPQPTSCTESIHSCMNCKKKKLSLFSDLKREELEELNADRVSVSFNPGEYIYKQGMRPEHLICLNSGKVKITRLTPLGKVQIVGLNKNVDFLGVNDLICNIPFTNSAVALDYVTTCIIPKSRLDQIIERNPDFTRKMMRMFASETTSTNARLISHTQKHLRGRLADTLIYIHQIFGFVIHTQYLDLDLKRSEIAELSNMDTSNTSRCLSQFANEGIITINGRKIEILDMARLHTISSRG